MSVMVGQNMLPSNSAYASSFGSGISNVLNGNLEFNRTQQLQQQQQIFNAEEAEKKQKMARVHVKYGLSTPKN